MRVTRRGVIAAAALSIAVVGLGATAALAWSDTCGNNEACIWENGPFVVPLAANPNGDSNYTNNNYPNTLDNLNDSASSVRNKFDVHDVVWYFDVGYSGTSDCLDHNSGAPNLSGFNDQFSSHLIAAGSTC